LGPAVRKRGQAGLRCRPRPGRPPKLTRCQLAQIPRLLAHGAEAYGFSSPIWTTQRVADLIWHRFEVRYDRDHVCRLLHRFGWSWQKPARRAKERDEAAIQHWVKHTCTCCAGYLARSSCASPCAASGTALTSSAPSSAVALSLFDQVSIYLYRYL